MRKSRVLLAGVAVAAAAAATSAFTAGNTFNSLDNNVAGYGDVTATGVNVSNIAYNPAVPDAAKLYSVVFTVDTDTSPPGMTAKMTLYSGTTVVSSAANSTCVSTTSTITCTLAPDILIASFDKT